MTITALGFDYGTHSIGTAIGQNLTCSATPLPAVRAEYGEPDWKKIDELIKEWKPQILVVGLPLNMDGTDQKITELARNFARELENRYHLKCHLRDERLTTVSAREQLFNNGGYRALKKGKVDSLSAVLILEAFLEELAGNSSN